MFLFNGNNQNENRSPLLNKTFFQILFYIVYIANILVGRNIVRQREGVESVLVGKKHTVQVMKGRGSSVRWWGTRTTLYSWKMKSSVYIYLSNK